MADWGPRENNQCAMAKAELLMFEAIKEIERMGADERLTNAQLLLGQAHKLVAEVINEKIGLKK